ncbi:phenylacetic acid degradation operon negative regulatory protein PaaX [Enterovibrio norvegicus]|uniref:Phenylacetic acid degradation operon negative regulatory protein PaaX n=1 Tax=Enterovibrio norvegicus TaxID=188144 RepID=A0ABV4L8N4_9GAMM|nr:phenylacetic acid degradation operon negative regulatory protein PaaX [Enterovibrio norvegicus]MCC4796743.1 phenylacetic acid degradation operon negative regulatory protein PaaX [Enterovibrio norvegicus]OEE57096.1 phenylacetic acid degradation operon negative regulatory protein PaaX [Enterovibrio norvegicus]OEF49727.1 phenylacetic acid degradation operon negative regulatory protein PaaX [Enterovibrio norvegicus]OEF55586.1 phenylacetic acid degradation operon negative regulatory protein PaaX 
MDQKLGKLLSDILAADSVSGTSLIMTVFGDILARRGGSISLSSLIELLSVFNVSDRFVRTSVFRLVKDGWLVAERSGRYSFYHVTEEAMERFTEAEERIYSAHDAEWNRKWQMISLPNVSGSELMEARKHLESAGYAILSTSVMLYPRADKAMTRHLLNRYALGDKALVFEAESCDLMDANEGNLKSLVARLWLLDEVEERFQTLLSQFRPVLAMLENGNGIEPAQAFQVRTLLIHIYRRALLKYPPLPEELLPSHWPGKAARTLTHNIYNLVVYSAEQHVDAVARAADGALPKADKQFCERFGGITLR